MLRKLLLLCGIASSLLYVAMNILIGLQYEGYSFTSQTVSELSAIGTATRPSWVAYGMLYTILVAGFGWGIMKSAQDNGRLRIVGKCILLYGLVGVLWPLAPMHTRTTLAAGGGTISDTLHIVMSFITVGLMLLAMAYGAFAFGKSRFGLRFRAYSFMTIVVLIALGILTGLEAPGISTNSATPFIGVWERIMIGSFLLWVMVIGVSLLPSGAYRDNRTMSPLGRQWGQPGGQNVKGPMRPAAH